MKRVAIIGFGVSGVSCFIALLKEAYKQNKRVEIDIYQPKKTLFGGLAYQDDSDDICLNHHHNFVSIDIDNPKKFSNWLENYYPEYIEKYKDHQPRWVFKKFIIEEFYSCCKKFNYNPKMVHENVNSISLNKNKYTVACNNFLTYEYDTVILAIGHSQRENIYGLEHPNYISSPYPTNKKLVKIKKNDSVAIIGMGLTGVDCVISLLRNNHIGKIYLISRNGFFSPKRVQPEVYKCKVFTKEALEEIRKKNKKNLKYCFMLFDKELNIASGLTLSKLFLSRDIKQPLGYTHWQNMLYSCNEELEFAWSILSDREKRIFFSRYHKIWLEKRTGVAPQNYDKLSQLNRANKLSFLSGLYEIKPGFSIYYENNKVVNSNWVINATGTPRFLNEEPVPLISSLIDKGLACHYKYGGIDVNFTTSELINKEGCKQRELYAIGQITTGVFLYTPITEHLVRHADKIAKHIINGDKI